MRIISPLRLVLARQAVALRRLVLVIDSSASAQNLPNTTRLLRFPATNDRQIVFCYAGELYTIHKDGGTARRLTSGPGYSSFLRFSADGTQLAFTSQYDGNTKVYVMPGEGGVPKRLTTTATLKRDDISDRMGPRRGGPGRCRRATDPRRCPGDAWLAHGALQKKETPASRHESWSN